MRGRGGRVWGFQVPQLYRMVVFGIQQLLAASSIILEVCAVLSRPRPTVRTIPLIAILALILD